MDQKQLFIFDTVLNDEEICNYTEIQNKMTNDLMKGRRLVLYGLRNTGKTSLLVSRVIPRLKKKNAIAIYADLFGVTSLEQLNGRLFQAIESAMTQYFPIKKKLDSLFHNLKSFRPVLKTDPIDGMTLSLEMANNKTPNLSIIFNTLKTIHEKRPCVLILDEFQDVHFVKEAEGLLRGEFQNLPSSFGLLLMGSKKHILARIFAEPRAPLAGFGEDVEFPAIPYEEYHQYMSERFAQVRLKISLSTSTFLQNLMCRNPEAINILCDQVVRLYHGPHTITEEDVIKANQRVVDLRQSRFEEFLVHFSESEQKVLIAIAQNSPVATPSGQEFVSKTRLSQKGVSKIVKKHLDGAVIYKTPQGYIIGDPLLAAYLRRYRKI